MHTVVKGYLWMHQSINLIFEFLLQSALLTLELLLSSFFPLLQQYSLKVFQLHLFNYESVSQKNKVIILQCEFSECLSGYRYMNENNI